MLKQKLITAVVVLMVVVGYGQVSQIEKEALQAIYNNTNGANWEKNTGWDFTQPVTSNWYGVTVVNGHVVGLDLSNNGLNGLLPVAIGDLIYLEKLNLRLNNLGALPQELSKLTALKHLEFSGGEAKLSYFVNMLNLENLDLYLCTLKNSTLSEITHLTNMVELRIGYGGLSGAIPQSIGNLTKLKDLNLAANNFTSGFSNLSVLVNLESLGMYGNEFLSGDLSITEGLTKLNLIDIRSCNFEGYIPANFNDKKNILISENRFIFKDLVGKITHKPNLVNSYQYAPQANIDTAVSYKITDGENKTLKMFETQTPYYSNAYQWYHNGQPISGAMSREYTITNFEQSKAGTYYCTAKNSALPDLTLIRNTITIENSNCPLVVGVITGEEKIIIQESATYTLQSSITGWSYDWKIKNASNNIIQTSTQSVFELSVEEAGWYVVELVMTNQNTGTQKGCKKTFQKNINVIKCNDCTSFDLSENKPYLITGWVKVGNQLNPTEQQYKDALVQITFTNADNQLITPNGKYDFKGSGSIIDGWQRVIGEFQVPKNTTYIAIDLTNTSTTNQDVYFDDIRVIPSEANMKSFVYDQQSQRLMSELDENNYATFYEYDKEGGLIRIKKETERGVYTIQETRSSNRKID